MKKPAPVILALAALLQTSGIISASTINVETFALDIASPSLLKGFKQSDILVPGPNLFLPGSSLGLTAADAFGDFSFGNDPITTLLQFSVDRVAVGSPGSAVYVNSVAGGANGSVYKAMPPLASNQTYSSDGALGLTGGLFGDDVHALSLMPYTGKVYFTLEHGSPSLGSSSAASIFMNSVSRIFASYATMGLNPGDEIDGLVLLDPDLDGVLNPGIDKALFSISTFSPDSTLMGGSMQPGGVYFTTFQGSSSLYASTSSLGLRSDDELHALATTNAPEPDSLLLVALGSLLLAAGAFRRRGCPKAVSILIVCAIALLPLSAQDRRDFCGIDMAIPNSGGDLVFRDLSKEQVFRWTSSDTTAGDVNTGFVKADTWDRQGNNPERIVFTGSGDGASIQGNALLDPANRATVTLTKNGKTVRYEVVLSGKLALGATAAGSADSCYKTYVPDRWGGKFNVTPDAGGALKDLRSPDGKPYSNDTEIGTDKHGWYTYRVAGKDFKVSNSFIQAATASTVPWNFFYFPYLSTDPRPLLYDDPGAYKKYDKHFGLKTTSFDWETDPANGHKFDKGEDWAGHCWGSAFASIILQQPEAANTFTQDELEGLGSEFFDNYSGTNFFGRFLPFEKPTAAAGDPTDRYVHNFHRGLREMILTKKKPVHLNLRQARGDGDAEVWNQGCYTYTSAMMEDPDAAGDALKEKPFQIKLSTSFVCNDDFVDPRNKKGVSTSNPKDFANGRREQQSTYILMYGDDGDIIPNGKIAGREQNWMTMVLKHTFQQGDVNVDVFIPRSMYDVTPAGGEFTGDNPGKNPHVTAKRLGRLGIKKNAGF